jgi:hypothetical protein
MIRIFLGNLGSGKTAMAVREMALCKHNIYTNINTTLKNCNLIRPENIIKRELLGYKKSKFSAAKEEVYKQNLNLDFWKNAKKPCHVYLDEAHSIINSRRSMSKLNVLCSEWMAMLRRVLNESDSKTGDLVLISQLIMKLDENARDMCTQISYHICHWVKRCERCHTQWQENSQLPEQAHLCINCGSDVLVKNSHAIEIMKFENFDAFQGWNINREKTFYDHYMVLDIHKYFGVYNSLQWDNLFTGYY